MSKKPQRYSHFIASSGGNFNQANWSLRKMFSWVPGVKSQNELKKIAETEKAKQEAAQAAANAALLQAQKEQQDAINAAIKAGQNPAGNNAETTGAIPTWLIIAGLAVVGFFLLKKPKS
jgi:hypothetical protein